MDLKKELVAGRTLSVRYGSRTRNSAQQREWRKLEAYARRMRDLLVEVRRGDAPPPAERLAEYERMLAAAAAVADDARRKQDDVFLAADAKPTQVL